MKLQRPIGARVMVEMIETVKENKTESGLILPGGEKKIAVCGRVLKMGDGMTGDVVEGNIIFFAPGAAYGLDPLDKIKLVDAGSIYAVVTED
jgi:co-chaperonin GroES (HSP10)